MHQTVKATPWKYLVIMIGLVCGCLTGTPLKAGTAELLELRWGEHNEPDCTRVVLEIRGPRPSKIGSASADEFLIEFQELSSKHKPVYQIGNRASAISSVKIAAGSAPAAVRIQFRHPGCSVNHYYLPGQPPQEGRYRLVMDVSPASRGDAPPREQAKPAPTAPAMKGEEKKAKEDKIIEKTRQVQPALPSEPTAELSVKSATSESLQAAKRAFSQGDFKQAYDLYEQFLLSPPLGKEEVSAALYGMADSYYLFYQRELDENISEVISHYLSAIRKDPAAEQAPWAFYRVALAYETLGDFNKTAQNLEQLVANFPKHPAVPLAWLALGRAYLKQQLYAEALRALRTALELPLDAAQTLQARWHLGESLYHLGQNPAAIKVFLQCLDTCPAFYQDQPLLLKYLSDAYFIEKQYDKALHFMLWYLNLSPGGDSRDLLLARIAEIFTLQDEKSSAQKIFTYIQSNFPNSEGEVIAKIRHAEHLEPRDQSAQEESLAIYQELSRRPLAEPLLRLVRFKFALREYEHGNYESSLKIIDQAIQESTSFGQNDELFSLRAKAVTGWCKAAFARSDYARVIRLHEENQNLFSAAGAADLALMAAESYSKLKHFPTAIAISQQLLSNKADNQKEELILKMAEDTFSSGDFEKAMQLLQQIRDQSLQRPKTRLMARIFFAQQQYTKVLDCFKNLPDQDRSLRTNDGTCSLYGESLLRVGDYQKALVWLEQTITEAKAQDSQPDELAHLYLAQSTCYSALKDHTRAIYALENAASLTDSEDHKNQLCYEISRLYLQMGQREKATEYLSKLLKSPQSFWQTAARQQIDYIQMQGN